MPLSPSSLSVQLKTQGGKPITLKRIISLFSVRKSILWLTATSLQLKNPEVQVWEQMTRHRNFQTGFATRGKEHKKFPHHTST